MMRDRSADHFLIGGKEGLKLLCTALLMYLSVWNETRRNTQKKDQDKLLLFQNFRQGKKMLWRKGLLPGGPHMVVLILKIPMRKNFSIWT